VNHNTAAYARTMRKRCQIARIAIVGLILWDLAWLAFGGWPIFFAFSLAVSVLCLFSFTHLIAKWKGIEATWERLGR
jgi:hypothetical protein